MSIEKTDRFTAKRHIFVLLGASFSIADESGEEIAFIKQKAFKLKEDIRVWRNREGGKEIMTIRARQVLDFAASYDVIDTETGEKLGVLRRKGLKSLFRDSWEILDADDRPYGRVDEDSAGLAAVRRIIGNGLLPQEFHVFVGTEEVGRIKQHFNPFVRKMTADFSSDTESLLPRKLGLAVVVLLLAIEGRQD